MKKKEIISGFSKLSQDEKLSLATGLFKTPREAKKDFLSFYHPDKNTQELLSGFSENTITNFPLPYNVAPNFLINDKMYVVPMVIEESSVVAAASYAARFWATQGGFKARVSGTEKVGQLHFLFSGDPTALKNAMPQMEKFLREKAAPVTAKMEKRGGGILSMKLKDFSSEIEHFYQLHVTFETMDAMGANFINSCLEAFSKGMQAFFEQTTGFSPADFEPLMAILSNYTPNCMVEVSASCPVENLKGIASGFSPEEFARRFGQAVKIAQTDVYRATTHNKGIMNGVDAVILATGNDFRAVEAAAHAYASRNGKYQSLSKATLENNRFHFSLEMPMAVGTLGGLTSLHPLAARSMELLGHPDAKQLMMIAAAAGLANNFAAVRSLITTGIQAGHMKMHLPNIMRQLQATKEEENKIYAYFKERKVSYQAVTGYLQALRSEKE